MMAAPDPATAIAALETALANGVLTVEHEGRRVTYRSAAEIRDQIAYFKRQQAAASSASRTTYATFERD